jgi:hypothetical protein
MSKISKIAVTVILIIVFFFAGILLQEAGSSRTFIALLAIGLFYGLRSMWKKPKENSSNEIKLDKSQQENNDLRKE